MASCDSTFGENGAVVAVPYTGKHGGGAAHGGALWEPSRVQRGVASLQRKPLVRIHDVRLSWHKVKAVMVEDVYACQERPIRS